MYLENRETVPQKNMAENLVFECSLIFSPAEKPYFKLTNVKIMGFFIIIILDQPANHR